jgi:hypothetical protein
MWKFVITSYDKWFVLYVADVSVDVCYFSVIIIYCVVTVGGIYMFVCRGECVVAVLEKRPINMWV